MRSAVAAVLLLTACGCAPKNESARTSLDAELAIARMTENRTGRIGEVIAGIAESLAGWRAHRVAVLPLRAGWVRVAVVPEAGEDTPELVQYAMPFAEAVKAAEPALLAAAGLAQTSVETPETVTIEMTLAVSSASGCRLDAQIRAAKAPEWHESWNVVPENPVPGGKQNNVEAIDK